MALFGLIDANSFYCSCERAFRPDLVGRPVVVLSNNDGCAIARTAEAKSLGIRMGDAYHLIRNKPELRDVVWFSSNYALYADMSRRIFEVISGHVPSVEPYSIDEMFMDLSGLSDVAGRMHVLRYDVLRATKVPTCVGFGPTKTIAKLANAMAKANPGMAGVCDLSQSRYRDALYRDTPVSEVWGLGRRTCEKLGTLGVTTVSQFVRMPSARVRKTLTVVGERIHAELQGVSCLDLEEVSAPRKGATVSRSFGAAIVTFDELRQALMTFTSRLSEKLRAENSVAANLHVFMSTGFPAPGRAPHGSARQVRIQPTSNVFDLQRHAAAMALEMWRDGIEYRKAGVMATEILPQDQVPQDLFSLTQDGKSRGDRISETMDAINARFGKGTVRTLSMALGRDTWKPRAEMLSRRYTTCLEELPEV